MPLPAPPPPASAAVRRRMQQQRTRDTAAELAVRRLVHGHGVRFRVGPALRVPGLSRPVRPDMAISGLRLAVFVDGCWWHGCPDHSRPRGWWVEKLAANAERDRRQTDALVGAGWCVLRVWEHHDPVTAAESVALVVRIRRWRQRRGLELRAYAVTLAGNLARQQATEGSAR